MKLARSQKDQAFTLIELLVVAVIVSIIGGVVIGVVNVPALRARSRDAQRTADINKMQVALESYFADNLRYPLSGSLNVLTPGYIPELPKDPADGDPYFYASNGEIYVLAGDIEVADVNEDEPCNGLVGWTDLGVSYPDDVSACYGVESPSNVGGCVVTSDCTSPTSDCQTISCVDAVCVPSNKPDSTSCADGYCFAGSCVDCVQASHCGSSPNECQSYSCEDNMCVLIDRTDGTSCSGGYCLDGSCVDCISSSQCSQPSNECREARCVSNSCEIRDKSTGVACSGGYCTQGRCVECLRDRDCPDSCSWIGTLCTCNACIQDDCERIRRPDGSRCFVDWMPGICRSGGCVCDAWWCRRRCIDCDYAF